MEMGDFYFLLPQNDPHEKHWHYDMNGRSARQTVAEGVGMERSSSGKLFVASCGMFTGWNNLCAGCGSISSSQEHGLERSWRMLEKRSRKVHKASAIGVPFQGSLGAT